MKKMKLSNKEYEVGEMICRDVENCTEEEYQEIREYIANEREEDFPCYDEIDTW